MTEHIAEDASADDLYDLLLRWLATFGDADEVAPGAIRIELQPDRDDMAAYDEQGADRQVLFCITREQLRSAAWADVDVFDDTDELVVPPTSTPVATGFWSFTFYAEEMLATLRPGETYLVFDEGRMHRSTRRELPPLRSDRSW